MNIRQPIKFIDLFAGIGGIRLPFDELGYECVFSSEWDKAACDSYEANFHEHPHGDITKISAEEIPPHDILLAGFPCQAFAISGQVSYPLLHSPELTKPRIRKDELKNIILGGGQNMLSPERRFDAIIVNSPELF